MVKTLPFIVSELFNDEFICEVNSSHRTTSTSSFPVDERTCMNSWSWQAEVEKTEDEVAKNQDRNLKMIEIELITWVVVLNYFLFSPLFLGKMNPFWRAYFSKGLVQPPTSYTIDRIKVLQDFVYDFLILPS